jgi:hypothetical protein
MPAYSPDAAAQAVSSITYGQTASTSTPTTLPLTSQASVNFVGSNKRNTVDHYLSFNPAAIAQISTFTVAATSPTAGDTVIVTVTDASAAPKTRILTYTVQSGDTLADVIEILLALITLNPYVYASTASVASPYTISVTSVIPGQGHTIAVTETGTSLTISATTIATAASGVVNYGKIFTTDINASVSAVSDSNPDAYFQVGVDLQSFDGAQPTAASSSGLITLAPTKHAKSIKALRAARGA